MPFCGGVVHIERAGMCAPQASGEESGGASAKDPQGAPLFGQMSGATSTVEQRDNAVRLYVRVSGSQLTGSASPTLRFHTDVAVPGKHLP